MMHCGILIYTPYLFHQFLYHTDENQLVDVLPTKMKTDLFLSVHYETLSKVSLFQVCVSLIVLKSTTEQRKNQHITCHSHYLCWVSASVQAQKDVRKPIGMILPKTQPQNLKHIM